MQRTLLVLIGCVAISQIARATESWVYVSVAGDNRIDQYRRDESTGALTQQSSTSINGEPGALTVDPSYRFLFASIRSTGRLVSFRLDGITGELEQVSEVEAGADPAYVSVDQTGKFLFSAYYRAGKVAVHRILANGTIAEQPVQELATADKAHAILTDPTNQFVFVPHTGPNAIFQFRFDSRSGLLRAADVPRVQRPERTGPRHLYFHPTKNYAYGSDEQGSSLTVYRFDPTKGTLESQQTESTLPPGYVNPNSTAHLEIHPSGRYAYVANRGHDSLALFEIDEATGRVKSQGQTPTEGTPRSFSISASGTHLYAAGQATGRVAAFQIDSETGRLSRFATYDVGERPWWIMVVDKP